MPKTWHIVRTLKRVFSVRSRSFSLRNLAFAIPETRAIIEARLATRLAKTEGPSAASGEADVEVSVGDLRGCEGGDLNPYASYGASTSNVDPCRDLSRFACFFGPPERRSRPLEAVWGVVDNEVDNAGAQLGQPSSLPAPFAANSGMACSTHGNGW